MATRKKYSKEFKLDAVSLVKDQGYNRSEVARSLGINTPCWVAGSKSMSLMTDRLFEGMES